MRRTITILSVMAMLVGMFAMPATASPATRAAACASIGGTYDEGPNSNWQNATCTVSRTVQVTSTEQVNNVKAAKQVLRTTSTSVTYIDTYVYSGTAALGAHTSDDGEPGDAVLVMCTPGSGYEACPTSSE